jgi:mannose-6-phosphate isomerase-like protein (cupin superfamily)
MKSIERWFIVAALVVMWVAHDDHSILVAQGRVPITVTRMYTGPDGQTHAGEIVVDLAAVPRLEHYERSETVKVTGSVFQRWSPGYENDWHPASHRQYLIVLSGRGEIEISNRQKIPLEPGRILLAEDVTGKGHITRAVGREDCITLLVQVAD